jgi:hypothetical protein
MFQVSDGLAFAELLPHLGIRIMDLEVQVTI